MLNLDQIFPKISIILELVPKEPKLKTINELFDILKSVPDRGSDYNWYFEKKGLALTRHFGDHYIECVVDHELTNLTLSITVETETKTFLTYICKQWKIIDGSIINNKFHQCYHYLKSTKSARETLDRILAICPELMSAEDKKIFN